MKIILISISFDPGNISMQEIIIAVVGYVIVFTVLLSLYYIFNNLKKVINLNIRNRLKKQGKHHSLKDDDNLHVTGDESAAISMALFLYFEQFHDEEDHILTIKRISKKYSPWSSKIYGILNNNPR
jgi:hypothetical protein